MAEKEKLFSVDFILVSLCRLFGASVFALMNATTAPYVMQNLGVDARLGGIAMGIFVITGIVSRVLAGHYTEVVGQKRLFVFGTAFMLFSSMLYMLPVGYIGFVIIRIINGLAFGVSSNLVSTVVVAFIPRSRFGEGMGYFALSSTVSYVIGPFLGLIVMQRYGAMAMFIMCAILALGALLVAIPARVPKPVGTMQERKEQVGNITLRKLFEVAALPLACIIFLLNGANGCVQSFVAVFTGEIGIGAYSSLYFLFLSFAMLFSRPLAGKLLDRKGDNAVMIPCFILSAAGYLVLALCQNVPMLILSAILQACGHATVFSTLQSIIVRDADSSRIGAATATFYTFADTGLGLCPMIMGSLQHSIGYMGIYVVCAVIALACLGFYLIIMMRKRS